MIPLWKRSEQCFTHFLTGSGVTSTTTVAGIVAPCDPPPSLIAQPEPVVTTFQFVRQQDCDYEIKIDLPESNGEPEPEAFIKWLNLVLGRRRVHV